MYINQICHQGTLASIHSFAEHDFLTRGQYYPGGEPWMWLGLHQTRPECDEDWSWTDGSHWDYTHWKYKEPKIRGRDEGCVANIKQSHGVLQSWRNLPCYNRLYYVCQFQCDNTQYRGP